MRLNATTLHRFFSNRFALLLPGPGSIYATCSLLRTQNSARAVAPQKKLEISRRGVHGNFLAVLEKPADFRNESGVSRLDLSAEDCARPALTILTEGRESRGDSGAKVVARPESTTLVYTSDTFTVRETFFVRSITGAGSKFRWRPNSPRGEGEFRSRFPAGMACVDGRNVRQLE